MKTKTYLLSTICAFGLCHSAFSQRQNSLASALDSHTTRPIEYIENQGQWNQDYLFRAAIGTNGMVYLQADGLLFDFEDPAAAMQRHDMQMNHSNDSIAVHHHAWKVFFENANSVKPDGIEPQNHYCNFFLGNDSTKWKSSIYPCKKVVYENLWDGIDMVIYSKHGNFKYDFIVRPYADPNAIQLRIEGADKLQLQNNHLVMSTSLGEFTDLPPTALCEGKELGCAFSLIANHVSFNVTDWNRKNNLIIDPMLIGASYAGALFNSDQFGLTGGFSTSLSNSNTIHCANARGAYAPVTLNAYDTIYGGDIGDPVVLCFNSDCTALIYCTYVGGNGADVLFSIETMGDNSLYISGSAMSSDFPTTTYAFDAFLNGVTDVFISHLSGDGTQLLESTLIGSSSFEPFRFELPVKPGGNTSEKVGFDRMSNSLFGMASSLGDWQANYPPDYFTYHNLSTSTGNLDFNVYKMTADLSTTEWVTRIGGSGNENTCDIKVLSNGNLAIYGSTTSADMMMTSGTYQSVYNGNFEGYIAILSPDGSEILHSTYFGGTGDDEVQYMQEDSQGRLWFCGQSSSELPSLGNGYNNPGSWQYIACVDSTLQSIYHYSPIGAGTGVDNLFWPSAFLIDVCDRIYITGDCFSYDFEGLPITPDALYAEGEFYMAVYEADMADLIYGGHLEGNHRHGGDNQYSRKGIVYQGICSNINNPVDPPVSAYSDTQVSTYEGSAWVIDFESPSVISQFSYVPTVNTCAPATFQFQNWSDSASYSWNFGDGSGWQGNQAHNVSHEFDTPGNYYVQLAAVNANSCNYADTTGWWITVPDGISTLVNSMDYSNTDLCVLPVGAEFSYTGLGETSFNWQDADGNVIGEETNLELSFDEVGDYTVLLIANDAACNYSDTLTAVISPSPAADASFTNVDGLLTAVANSGYQWYLDGEVIEGATNQTYEATETGNYSVEITNAFGCTATSDDQLVEVGVGELLLNDIILFPNPAGDELTVTFPSAASRTIKLLDAEGRVVKDFGVISKKMCSVDCSALASGGYFIQVVSAEGDVVAKGFVKE